MAQSTRIAAELQKQLGYRFSNPALLITALTHSSADAGVQQNNERLEFLGDRILALAVAEMLLARYPDAREGQLAPRLNALVCRKSCAEVARGLELGRYLILDHAEAASGGRDKPAILADGCEALIAALYLDGGSDVARRFIETHWADKLDATEDLQSDPKSALQEWSQGRNLGIPSYNVIEREGPDHAPSFVVEAELPGLEPARGSGSSKREAEREAAREMLRNIGQPV